MLVHGQERGHEHIRRRRWNTRSDDPIRPIPGSRRHSRRCRGQRRAQPEQAKAPPYRAPPTAVKRRFLYHTATDWAKSHMANLFTQVLFKFVFRDTLRVYVAETGFIGAASHRLTDYPRH